MNNIIFASVISEIQQSPMFMTVKAVICDTPEANLNGARVTEKFVNEVVKNEKRYVGLPLYADVKALTRGEYNRLGHLYDVKTGEFHSTQIGSFYKFAKEEFENGYHLIGYARIPKRNQKLSNAIAELFTSGKLKFSFEVAVGEYEENDDGTITIDASENNYLEGTAIVTYPACEDAVALELVAQKAKADIQEGGEQEMLKETLTAEQETQENKATETVKENVNAEAETAEQTETEPVQAEAEKEVEAEDKKEAEDENAACKKKEKAEEETSTAEVYVRETTTQAKETHAYDSESGKSVHQEVVVRTSTEDMVEGTLVEADDGMHIAQETNVEKAAETETVAAAEETNETVVTAAGDEGGEGGETPAETPAETPTETPTETPVTATETPEGEQVAEGEEDDDPATDATESKKSKKTAEQMIAELAETVEALRNEIAELKEQKVVAQKNVTAEINPLMSDIKPQKTYSVLEKEKRNITSYSVLDKA